MAALQALGAAQAVRAAGHLAPHAGYQDPAGRWLLRIPADGAGLGKVATVAGKTFRRPPIHRGPGSSRTLTAPVRRESFSARIASSQHSSGKRWVMTGVRSNPPAMKSK